MKETNVISKLGKSLKSIAEIFITCFSFSWNASKFHTVVRLLCKIATALISVGTVVVTKNIIDLLSGAWTPADQELTLILLLVLIFVLRVLTNLFNKLSEYSQLIHDEMIQNGIKMHMYSISIQADIEFFDSKKYYDAFQAVERDIISLTVTLWSVFDGIGSIVTAISAAAILSQVSIWIAIVIIVTVIPSTFFEQKYTRLLYRWGLEHITEERKLDYLGRVMTQRNYAPDVRLHNIGDILRQRYKTIWAAFFKEKKALTKKRSMITMFLTLLPETVIVFATVYLAFSTFHAAMTIGDYSMYTGMLAQLSSGIYLLTALLMRIYEGKLRIDNIDSFKNYSNRVLNKGKRTVGDSMSITFRHVKFHYPDTDAIILDDVSFTIEDKTKVCLIGINGAGKSTIIKLLLRFYDVDAGEILVNDYNIKEYELNDLRKNISCLFQKYNNYAFSLRENVAISDFGNSNVDDQLIYDSLRESDCIDILDDAAEGLDTYLTKEFVKSGMELSGGQQQKIAISRLFYQNSKMIILDEPSASLDPEAEYKIFQSFETLCKGRTAIFTSHRLTNVHLADKIVVLENGKIIEQGTHEELMAHPKRYSVLYKYQADKFKEYDPTA